MDKAQKENVVFLIAEIKLSYHPKVKASQRKKIASSQQAYDMLLQQWDQGTINLNKLSGITILYGLITDNV